MADLPHQDCAGGCPRSLGGIPSCPRLVPDCPSPQGGLGCSYSRCAVVCHGRPNARMPGMVIPLKGASHPAGSRYTLKLIWSTRFGQQ